MDIQNLKEFPIVAKESNILPNSVINYVTLKRETVVVDNAQIDPRFVTDKYFLEKTTQSVICMPIMSLGELVGLIYLENDIAKGAFNEARLEMLKMLSGQIAVTLENSILYQNLEQKVEERTRELAVEKAKSDELLLNILPAKVAAELKSDGKSVARRFENVTVFFSDIVGFTEIASTLEPEKLVSLLDEYFNNVDEIMTKYGLEKIKTIGDAYMAVGGVPTEDPESGVKILNAAFEILDYIEVFKQKQMKKNEPFFQLRIGINSGPIIAGVVGKTKFVYDIWGDTVNIASRLETAGEAGRINISRSTKQLIGDHFHYIPRGSVAVKNRGEIEMFFVERK